MPTPSLASRSLAVAALLATACTADDPVDRPGTPDAAVAAPLAPPVIQAVAERTPMSSVAVRGTTQGARIVSLSPAGTQITAVLPGGTFCQDAELEVSGTTHLEFYSVGGDGRISDPTVVEVTHDPSAPTPAMSSCTGDGGGACGEVELCGFNNIDEDCDGWADACDLACSECTDDVYEPNDVAVEVPTIPPGTYPLAICPCRDDWFAFSVAAGGIIDASASFSSAAIDLDMRLYHVDGSAGGTGTQVASAVTTTSPERILYTAPAAGTYYLRIYPFRQEAMPSGTYTLVIR